MNAKKNQIQEIYGIDSQNGFTESPSSPTVAHEKKLDENDAVLWHDYLWGVEMLLTEIGNPGERTGLNGCEVQGELFCSFIHRDPGPYLKADRKDTTEK